MSLEPGNKALFIDRDGTINHDCPYCHDPSDLRIYDDSVSIMKEYRDAGFLIIIITNQSGINRGYFTVEQFNAFNDALKASLRAERITIDGIYYCPHRPDEKCKCRKPETELLDRAIKDFHIDPDKSIVIGDRDDMDGEMARRRKMKYRILKR